MSNLNRALALTIVTFLFLLLPGVQAGHLQSQQPTIDFALQATETDTITLTTENSHAIDLQFIALNPAGNPMPITSLVGFNTRIETTSEGFKWAYDLQLPNSNFKALVRVTSLVPITIIEDKYVVVDGTLISFDDVLEYGYSYILVPIDDYSAEFEITKDYAAHGLSPGDMIIIDPTITAYPENDGYLRQNNLGVTDTFLSANELEAGVIDASPDTGDYIFRSYARFDTSEIDYFDGIINATLRIYLTSIITSGGQTCQAILQSISDFEDLGSLDWDVSNTTINSSFVLHTDATGVYYEQDISNYVTKEGITAFRIIGSHETMNSEDCYFTFSSNETANSPELEIYWEDGTAEESLPLFNISETTSKQVYAEDWCGFGNTLPYDPKIACESDGDTCVAIFYDDSVPCFRGVKYSLSRDGFDTIEHHGVVAAVSFSASEYLDPMRERGGELPYDIVWDDGTNIYYIVIFNKIYIIPAFDPEVAGVTPYRSSDGYALPDGRFIGADLTPDCCVETDYKAGQGYSCASNTIRGFKFNSDDATQLFGTFQARPFDSSPTDWDAYMSYFTYDVTNTTTTANGNIYDCAELYTSPSCSAAGTLGIDYYSAYAEWSGTAWKYNIEAQLDYCAGTADIVHDFDNLGSPNDDFNHFYFGGNLYYRNETIFSVLASETSDLVTFNPPEFKYNEEEAINEIVNQSDADGAGASNFFIWYRSSDLTDGTDGIWIQEQTTYPVIVSSNKDVFVTISCAAEDYTTTGSGKILQLFTPCLSENVISFVSSFDPQYHTASLSFDSCEIIEYTLYYADSPYDFTLTVKDAITNENLPGVVIEASLIDFSIETDSNGQAVFEVSPIDDKEFKTVSGTCEYDLSLDGTPRTLLGEATLIGYVDSLISLTPAELIEADINVWVFDDNDLLTMFPEGVIIEVHAYTSDGEEITTSSYNASVTGNNDLTYTFINEKESLRNFNKNLPATFLLYDNRTTYNVTVSLDYLIDTDTQDIEVTVNEQYNAYFYLPFTFLDLPCEDSSNCVDDFCDDSGFHHRLVGCVDSVCQYDTTDCQAPSLCDLNGGCFQLTHDIPCSNDNECVFNDSVTYCIDEVSMYAGFCGEDGFCKSKEKQCSTFCNETIGYCNERAACLVSDLIEIGYEYGGGHNFIQVDCSFDNAGESYCEQFGKILAVDLALVGETIGDVYFSHEGFLTRLDGDGYEIGDVVVSCSDSCELDVEFCPSGECSFQTNQCLKGGSSGQLAGMVGGGWDWFAGLIPVELRFLAWIVITLVTMAAYKIKTGKEGKDNDRTTLLVGGLIFFAGIGMGWVHWIFMVIIAAIISIIMWKQFT